MSLSADHAGFKVCIRFGYFFIKVIFQCRNNLYFYFPSTTNITAPLAGTRTLIPFAVVAERALRVL